MSDVNHNDMGPVRPADDEAKAVCYHFVPKRKFIKTCFKNRFSMK